MKIKNIERKWGIRGAVRMFEAEVAKREENIGHTEGRIQWEGAAKAFCVRYDGRNVLVGTQCGAVVGWDLGNDL